MDNTHDQGMLTNEPMFIVNPKAATNEGNIEKAITERLSQAKAIANILADRVELQDIGRTSMINLAWLLERKIQEIEDLYNHQMKEAPMSRDSLLD